MLQGNFLSHCDAAVFSQQYTVALDHWEAETTDKYLYASELGWGGDWQTSSVGELSAVPLNQERGHTHKERRVSTDGKRDEKEMTYKRISCEEKVIKGFETRNKDAVSETLTQTAE